MRYGAIVALGMSVLVLAVIRPPIPQVRAQFLDVVLFAPVSVRGPLDELNALFLYENGSGAKITYGNSLELAKQVENGAPADVFLSADPESMDYLAERKLIDASSRDDLLLNKLVLVAPANSNVTLTVGKDFPLAQALGNGRLAMGDPAAAGKYGKAALENLGAWASVAGKVAPAQDVRAALTLVSRGEAPLGIVLQTDAVTDKSVKIVGTFPEASHPKIIYPVAVTARSTNIVAPVFVQFLFSNKASPYFEKYGFTVL